MLCLTKYTVSGPSSRYRVHQFLPFFERSGIEVDIRPLHDDTYLRGMFAGKRPSPAYLLKRSLTRAGALLGARRYDVVLIQKEIFPSLPGIAEWALQSAGARLVVDIDDAVFAAHTKSSALRGKFPGVLRRSALVLAGNRYLKNYAERYAKNVVLFPTVVDSDKFRAPANRRESATPVCGWIGTPVTAVHMTALLPVLERLAATTAFRLKLIGVESLETRGLSVECVPWRESTEVQELSGIDIGVTPQETSEWTKGKCALKLLQYMSMGMASVSSPTGAASEIIIDGDNGYLAETPEEWCDKLQTLVSDRDLARRMGQRARAWIEENYNLRKYGPKLAVLLRDVAQDRYREGTSS
jgi:glycosyltransferase involved in cell wall biosynthesis